MLALCCVQVHVKSTNSEYTAVFVPEKLAFSKTNPGRHCGRSDSTSNPALFHPELWRKVHRTYKTTTLDLAKMSAILRQQCLKQHHFVSQFKLSKFQTVSVGSGVSTSVHFIRLREVCRPSTRHLHLTHVWIHAKWAGLHNKRNMHGKCDRQSLSVGVGEQLSLDV